MVELVSYNEIFLDKSWHWLNDPEIKRLTLTGDFTQEDQEKWFKSLKGKSDYLIWGAKYSQRPIGVFGIKNIKNGSGEYWGYIGEKEYWNKGLGTQIINIIIQKATEMGLLSIYLYVTLENKRAITSYTNAGFSISMTDGSKHLMKKHLITSHNSSN